MDEKIEQITLEAAELTARFIEDIMQTARPAGMTGKQAVEDHIAKGFQDEAEALVSLSRIAILYFVEQMKKSLEMRHVKVSGGQELN